MAKLKGGSYVAGLLTVEGACIAEEFSKPDGATLVTIRTASPPTVGIIPKVGASSSSLMDSIISELNGVITVDGALASNSLRIGANVASIDALGNVAGKSLAVTGAVTGKSLSITSGTSGASIDELGNVTGKSLAAAGAVAGKSLAVTEAVSCASIQATGNISAATLSIKDAVAAYKLRFVCSSSLTAERTLTFNTSNANRVITLGANLSVSAASVTLEGSGTGSTLVLPAGTTTFSALTSGHVLYASAANTVSGEASLSVSRGGTARATLTANYLLYGAGTNAVGLLAPNTTTTPKFLRSVSSGAPAWYTIPNAALDNSEITINGTAVSLGSSITISTGTSVNYAKSTSEGRYNVLWVAQGVGGLTQVYSTDSIQVNPSVGTLAVTGAVSAGGISATNWMSTASLEVTDRAEVGGYPVARVNTATSADERNLPVGTYILLKDSGSNRKQLNSSVPIYVFLQGNLVEYSMIRGDRLYGTWRISGGEYIKSGYSSEIDVYLARRVI